MLNKKVANINNKTYYYYDEGSGNVLLLLHGWFNQSDDYLRLTSELSTKYRIITPDLPNFGNSKTAEPLNLDTYLQFLNNFIKFLKINPAFIGHSFGGRLALEYSIRKKIPVTKIVLINSAGINVGKNKLQFTLSLIFNSINELFTQNNFFSILTIYKNWLKNFLSNVTSDNFWGILSEILFTNTPFLSDLKINAILLWGEQDYIFNKAYSKKLNCIIKNSKLVFIKGGHFSCMYNVKLFSQQIIKFIN
jgi:pimeloyl-ACP methyl ester carboxylesterase